MRSIVPGGLLCRRWLDEVEEEQAFGGAEDGVFGGAEGAPEEALAFGAVEVFFDAEVVEDLARGAAEASDKADALVGQGFGGDRIIGKSGAEDVGDCAEAEIGAGAEIALGDAFGVLEGGEVHGGDVAHIADGKADIGDG